MNANKRKLVARILSGYGLAYAAILPAQKGYRNKSYPVRLTDDTTVNLMLHKTEPEALALIRRANNVSTYLADQGFPCRTMLQRVAQLEGRGFTKYAAIYSYLPGHTIPWEAYTQRHIKLLGKTMSDMHAVLANYTDRLPDIAKWYTALNSRMISYFAEPGVVAALQSKLNLAVRKVNFEPLFAFCHSLPNQQALHMDFVRGNILFEGEGDDLRISGILDFEKTARGGTMFDIARTLAFLIVDCKYKDEQKVRKYFLHSGYRKRGAASFSYTTATKRLLHELVTFNMLHDFYKFLRHNPYESLPQNQHFVRTRDLLLTRGIIKYT